MKLIVQIPCFNERATLPQTIAAVPRLIPGLDRVEVLVIDDGSTDGTAEVARRAGADHVVRHLRNRGLGRAFQTGLQASLRLGADIIVNTDADHQYPGSAIPDLIRPILENRADIAVGDRQTDRVPHFSLLKRLLQRLGSAFVRRLSGTAVPDAVCGFRALSRDAAQRLNIVSSFSYTIEMLLQAGKERLAVVAVPVTVNPQTRASRLFRSLPQFVAQSLVTALRTYTMYKPLRVFSLFGALLLALGAAPVVRFLFFYLRGEGGGHVQSLVLGGVLVVLGAVAWLVGILSDLIAVNRSLLENVLERLRELERRGAKTPDDEL